MLESGHKQSPKLIEICLMTVEMQWQRCSTQSAKLLNMQSLHKTLQQTLYWKKCIQSCQDTKKMLWSATSFFSWEEPPRRYEAKTVTHEIPRTYFFECEMLPKHSHVSSLYPLSGHPGSSENRSVIICVQASCASKVSTPVSVTRLKCQLIHTKSLNVDIHNSQTNSTKTHILYS